MDEEKISPLKNNSKNKADLLAHNKRLILESKRPFNNIQISSQFRVCNKRFLNDKNDEDEKKSKQKISNINTNINIFRLNSASKNNNIMSLSQEKTRKSNKEHEDNLIKIKELEKILEELNKNKNDLSNEIDKLNNEENKLQDDLNKKEDEEKGLNEELGELKNINEDKNREYLNLMQLNQQQMNNNNNRPRRDNNINGENRSINNIINTFLRMRDQVNNENSEAEVENGGQNNINDGESSINESNYEIDVNEDFGPPMSFKEIDELPAGKYPKKEIYEEKCVLCGFTFYYNDSITILDKCKHTFHKECLCNFLINKLASKCPICKLSIIG